MRVRPLVCVAAIAVVLAIVCCSTFPKARYESDPELQAALAQAPAYPEVRFVVLSDPHYMDPGLWGDGPAIERYLRGDRKLLRESPEILDEAVRIVAGVPAELVIVPGDMTKDGERSSHLQVAEQLRALEAGGKQVFAICGNHDILNPEAYRYQGDQEIPVDTVSPEEFAEIYAEFGYAEALDRDPASLSYVAEPLPGLRLLALDDCLYLEEPVEGHSPVGGRFSEATLAWMDRTLAEAALEGKAVLAMVHHGIMEHFPSAEKHYEEYMVEGFPEVARMLAAYNVRVVFTGHFHAHDITLQRWPDGKFVYDVETGSLITYPCPLRVCSIRDNSLYLETRRVERIPSHPSDFQEFSREYTSNAVAGIAIDTMRELKVKEEDALFIAPQVARAFVAHYGGDEQPPETVIDKKGVGFMGRLVLWNRGSLIRGLWQDLEPPDHDLLVDLGDGSWVQR
ncbi:MAG: metallophosphoesterase [Spirochaetales bacterium]|nr:metallophosphoesterase [Spirochaetales bacterium]